jgi:DNA polymerase-3 subunit delta
VLEDHAAHPSPDVVTLITLPRLDRAAQGAAWFAALESAGVSVAVWPIERDELPRWLAERLKRQRQRVGDETLQFLADATEGNLLAAKQEIDKLALLLPEGELEHETVLRAVADVSRFDVFQLSEAWLGGDAARALRILVALEAAGEGVPLLLWQLGEDLHALASVVAAASAGTPTAAAVRNARAWGKRQAAMERAARRVDAASLRALLLRLARLDALAKGIGEGSVWDELADAALALAGRPLRIAERTPV